MVDLFLRWVLSVNPLLIWLVGGLICWAAYLVAVPATDDPRANRDRAFVAGGLIIVWPSLLIWLGPLLLAAWVWDRLGE